MSRAGCHIYTTALTALLTAAVNVVPAAHAQNPQAQSQPTTATASQPGFDQRRLNDLLAVVEGQNSPQARRTAARELLHHGWSETAPRLMVILRSPNEAAKVAVALALANLPQYILPEYTEPLLAMLASEEPQVRQAATAALACSRDDELLPRLQSLALTDTQPLPARLAAIDTLGMMTRREAVAVLVQAMVDQTSPVAAPALTALEQATAQDFNGDIEAALAWWSEARGATSTEWQRMQIQRLARQSRARHQHIRELEQRLANALRENYLRTLESERPALLNAYLSDASAAVRQLGLALAQSQLAEGKALADETCARVRELLFAQEASVRAAAVRTVATLRDPADAERFRLMLTSERHHAVREALVNGLGYVGTTNSVTPLLAVLETADRVLGIEVVIALGRLAERGVLDEACRCAIASALLAQVQVTPKEEHGMRERLLWAMSRVGDPRFGAEFVAALDTSEAAAVRLAAVRGIAVLADPRTAEANGQTEVGISTDGDTSADSSDRLLRPGELLDALALATNDCDPGVRRAAVEALAQYAATDAHLTALWNRLSAEQEPEADIRITAWRGAMRVIAGRPIAEIEKWLELLPGAGKDHGQHAVELLQAAESHLAAKPKARAELGWVRARLAAERAALNQTELALSTYLMAFEDLHSSESPDLQRVAAETLRLALLSDSYDEQVAAALTRSNPPLDGHGLWEAVRSDIDECMQSQEPDHAIAMLTALQSHPPASMPADIQQTMKELLQRARQQRASADASIVESALQALAQDPQNEQARETIVELGPRAVSAVHNALRSALETEQIDEDRILQLHDLLRQLLPDWPGFQPDATLEQKLKAVEEAVA